MRGWSLLSAAMTLSVFAAAEASGQSALQEPVRLPSSPVDIRSPAVAPPLASPRRSVGDASSRRGVLLRSNVALTTTQIRGVEVGYPGYGALRDFRFATVNHISIGYGWRKDFAPTIDGFRLVVPHRPNGNEIDKFKMRVDAEALGIGFGTTSFYRPLSLHVGQAMGYVMGRVGGGILDALKYKGFGGLAFVGYELIRSQRIGIVLSAQVLSVLLFDGNRQLVTRSVGASLGVTYW